MAIAQPKITVACEPCDATGVLLDKAPGVGVVCAKCEGKGHHELAYRPFVGQKRRVGIDRVRLSGQAHPVFSTVATATEISYVDFLRGKRP